MLTKRQSKFINYIQTNEIINHFDPYNLYQNDCIQLILKEDVKDDSSFNLI